MASRVKGVPEGASGSVVRHSNEALTIVDDEYTRVIGDSRKDCAATTITDQR